MVDGDETITPYIKLLDAYDGEGFTAIFSNDGDSIRLGTIRKVRVGRWFSWCLFLEPDCYMSASCLDTVREKIRELNRKKQKGGGKK